MTDRDGAADNPLLNSWNTPFEAPPFADIQPEHYRPAFDAALEEHRAEIAAIASDPAPAGFANTIEALEKSGALLSRVSSVFFNLAGADTSDALEEIERDLAPLLSRHHTAIYLDERLFARVAMVFDAREHLPLTSEQQRLLERVHTRFRRNGAGLPKKAKARLAEIDERLALLGTQFGQNVLADEKSYALILDGEADLAGLPDFLRASAAQAAEARGHSGKHAITLGRSSIEPFLTFSQRRDLRREAFAAWARRGENGGATDNRAIVTEMVALRAERARILGFDSFAHFRLDDTMARTPDAALDLLNTVWGPARERAVAEREALQALLEKDGESGGIEPADWRFYAERQRKALFDVDEGAIKPYLQLEKIIEAAFDTATRLFGVTFEERKDVPVYHPAVRAWEVKDRAGGHLGLFLGDYYARPSKHSGAWMSSYRDQEKLAGEIRPIVVNVMNFVEPAPGEPALLSMDDARTLFHEFGHGLHGLLSNVTYPSLSGTSVSRDFVEFPSQLYEHWLEQPQVLRRFARHFRTGEPMPEDLIERLVAARRFNQGFATVEYVSSALVDMEFHLLPDGGNIDPIAFEHDVLERIDLPAGTAMRHRTPHFLHVFAGEGYSAGYYSYLWSEVLDADGFDAFEEAGDIFDPETARRLHKFVYSAGNTRDPAEAYRGFRGRLPSPGPLLRKRGFDPAQPAGEA